MNFAQIIKKNIPNSITCLNLLSGCLAVIFAFHYNDDFGALKGYQMVYIFIGLAAIFDFCDGMVARLLHAYSSLGKELDSLSDLVSFGVAPAMLIFNTIRDYEGADSYIAYVALIIAVFGALRLAKFNIDDRQATSFIGLPIPANAIFWIGFCEFCHEFIFPPISFVVVAILVMSYMMVAQMSMFSLKVKSAKLNTENILRIIILAVAVLMIIIMGISGFALTIIIYILLSAFSKQKK